LSSTEPRWRHFERLVAAIHAAQDKGATVRWDEKIDGRQFDVTVRFRSGLYDYLTVIECKAVSTPVKAEVVDALVTKARDAGAHKAVIASTAGFQPSAYEVAKRYNIVLLSVQELDALPEGLLLGEPVEALHIQEVVLNYKEGGSRRLPIISNVLAYYMHHVRVTGNGADLSLSRLIDQIEHRLQRTSGPARSTVQLLDGAVIVAPEDDSDVVPTGPATSISFVYSFVKVPTLQTRGIDPTIFSPQLQIRDEISGRTFVLDQGGLPLGLDTTFVPGKFYEAVDVGFYWFCKAVNGDTAVMILVESFQHGQLLQATATMSAGRSKFYVEVTDAQVVARLERRLRRYSGQPLA
jgi:Restriction endonuclease